MSVLSKKLFIALCIAAPLVFAIAQQIFRRSVTVAGVFMATGFVLSVVLLGWLIWNLFYHRRRAMLGLGSLLVCFGYFAVLTDYFASHAHRQRQSADTNKTEFSK